MSDTPTMDPAEQLKTDAVKFVMALSNPKLGIREVAWEGISASLALFTTSGDVDGLRVAISRMRDLIAAK